MASRIYSDYERKTMYGFYVKQPDMPVSEIAKKLEPFGIHVKPKTLDWLMVSWGWALYRKLSRYQNIVYEYEQRHLAEKLPKAMLDKISKENIQKINSERRRNFNNRKYRHGLKTGNLVQKIDVIDITVGHEPMSKVVSEVVVVDNEKENETYNKTPNMPTLSGLRPGHICSFTVDEERAYKTLTNSILDYSRLHLAIERLMREIPVGNNPDVTLLSKYSEVMQRLEDETLLAQRRWLIQKRQEDLSNEQMEQVRVNEALKYSYVNQGLRDESRFDQGVVRTIEFVDEKTRAKAQGIVWTPDDQAHDLSGQASVKQIGMPLASRPARLNGKHLLVMAALKPMVFATQINNIGTPQGGATSDKKKQDALSSMSIAELEAKNEEADKLISIIKLEANKLQVEPLDSCDDNCPGCPAKLSCKNSTLKDGIMFNEPQ